jgi:homotetrameric cytidine deaminase
VQLPVPKVELMTDEELIALARTAAAKAYAPYSNFNVGCAIESVDGEVVTGANMENACYRLGLCAEHSALTAALQAFGLAKVEYARNYGSAALRHDDHAVDAAA